jgi:hypothetical protein
MKALIDPSNKNRIVEVQKNEFAVAIPYFWVECSDDITPSTHIYVDGKFVYRNINEIIDKISKDTSKISQYKDLLLNDSRYDFSHLTEDSIKLNKCC